MMEINFIGYILKYPKEREILELRDSSLLNLHKLKGIIRLIDKVEKIINAGYSFSCPFRDVNIIEGFQNEVQIVQTECIKKEKNVYDTVRYTVEYINLCIKSSKNIMLDPFNVDYTEDGLEIIKKIIEAYTLNLTKYCRIHGYYEKDYLCCPKCLDKEKQDYVLNGALKLNRIPESIYSNKINEGGEAIVYGIDTKRVLKVFKKDEIDLDYKTRVICTMLQKNDKLKEIEIEESKKNIYHFRYVTIDKVLVDNNKTLHSYIMEKIDAMHISILKNRKYVEDILSFSRKDILEILINLGKGIEYLHSLNIYIGDLNGRNIMFDNSKTVYFIDFDGMGVDDLKPEFFTDGYVDPISKKKDKISMDDDWYSYAVQAFYYLTYVHPFNYTNGKKDMDILAHMELRKSILSSDNIKLPSVALKWDWMPEEIKNTFKDIFENGKRINIAKCFEKYYDMAYEDKYKTSCYIDNMNNANNNKKDEETKYDILDITDNIDLSAYRLISDTMYIKCENDDGYYIKDKENQNIKIQVEYPNEITNVYKDDKNVFVEYGSGIDVYDINTLKKIYISEALCKNYNNIAVNGKYLYSTSYLADKIKRVDLEYGNDTKYISIGKGENILALECINNSKFVTVREDKFGTIKVYCNKELFYTFKTKATDYRVIYNKENDMWLVIDNNSFGIVIRNDGTYKEIDLNTKCNVNTAVFDLNTIYVPIKDWLVIYNLKTDKIIKIEVRDLIGFNSKIIVNNDGFLIINPKKKYKVIFKKK